MYNFALAFVLCAVAYLIGDAVSILTKAWVPSVFVTAIVLLIGYWTVLPAELISDSKLIPFGSTIGIYLLITHMGTIISLKQLGEQWKTIVVWVCASPAGSSAFPSLVRNSSLLACLLSPAASSQLSPCRLPQPRRVSRPQLSLQ